MIFGGMIKGKLFLTREPRSRASKFILWSLISTARFSGGEGTTDWWNGSHPQMGEWYFILVGTSPFFHGELQKSCTKSVSIKVRRRCCCQFVLIVVWQWGSRGSSWHRDKQNPSYLNLTRSLEVITLLNAELHTCSCCPGDPAQSGEPARSHPLSICCGR